jgi:type I restriction enzyme M protein
MSTDLTRSKVKALWNIISASGLASSPIVAVEQISCLILIKYLKFIDKSIWWSTLLKSKDPGALLTSSLFPKLRSVGASVPSAVGNLEFNGLFNDAYFQLEASKPEALTALLQAIDGLFNFSTKRLVKSSRAGDAFDLLLSIAAVGGNSLNTTPRELSRFLVSLLDPNPGDRLIDPAVGTARLLLDAEQYMGRAERSVSESPVGVEVDKSVARIGWMNLLLHSLNSVRLQTGNSVTESMSLEKERNNLLHRDQYDVVLGDLPFGNVSGYIQAEEASYLPLTALGGKDKLNRRLELLFIWRTIDLLKVDGRAALIIPQSVLYGTTSAHRNLRNELITQHVVEAVILLPQSTPAAILLFKKSVSPPTDEFRTITQPRTRSVWFYEASSEEVPALGKEGVDNDLYDALVHYRRQALLQDQPLENGLYYQPNHKTSADGKDYSSEELVTLKATVLEPVGTGRRLMSFFSRPSAVNKQWRVPVREWTQKTDWRDKNGQIVGSHDEYQRVRAEYEAEVESTLYVNGELQVGFLEPNCIEARRWSLDINDYRWPEAPLVQEGASTLELIDELREIERGILQRLDGLRSLLGDEQ